MNEQAAKSIRWGIAQAKKDRSTFYGFYTGEQPVELYSDFYTEMPKLMFDGDSVAEHAYRRTISHYVDRMAMILADAEEPATA